MVRLCRSCDRPWRMRTTTCLNRAVANSVLKSSHLTGPTRRVGACYGVRAACLSLAGILLEELLRFQTRHGSVRGRSLGRIHYRRLYRCAGRRRTWRNRDKYE